MAVVPTPLEIGWLSGIFEGEGSARIFKHGNRWFYAQVSAVSNTDPTVIERVSDLLNKIGIRSNVRDNGNRSRNPNYSKAWDVRITKYSDVVAFLQVVLPNLSGIKRNQAELVLAFVRLSRPNRGKSGRSMRAYQADLDLYSRQHFRPHRTDGVAVN